MYNAIFFSLDGDYQREGNFETIKEAENYISNIGSRWIFYPLCFVCTDKYIVGDKRTTKKRVIEYRERQYNEEKQYDECESQWIWDNINNGTV